MAKKAGRKATTTPISLLEAWALVVKVYGAVHLAEKLLKEWLGDGRVRWSCKLFVAARVSDLATQRRESEAVGLSPLVADVAYSAGDAAFWRDISLEINWEENWAKEMYVAGGNKAYGISVVREDVLALLPAPSGASKEWITAEVQQMKLAGEIPPTITELAQELERRMEKAERAGIVKKSVGWLHIKNKLPEWGLWTL
jgi:hypothetical protein